MLAAALLVLSGCGLEKKSSDESDENAPPPGPPVVKIGQRVDVQADAANNRGFVPLGVTLKSVEPGAQPDLAQLDGLDPGQTPYYLRVSYTNVAGARYTSPVSDAFTVYQSDGKVARPLVITVGSFEPCDNATPPQSFARPNATFDACVPVLATAGTTVTKVEWSHPNGLTEATWTP